MFFKKNSDKYNFLSESSKKFTELSTLLEEGNYTSIKGTSAIGDKLRVASYDFFQDSLKDNDDEFQTQTQTVVILAPVPQEESATEDEFEDVSSVEEAPQVEESEEEPTETIPEANIEENEEATAESEATAEDIEEPCTEEDFAESVEEIEEADAEPVTEIEEADAEPVADIEETDADPIEETIVESTVAEDAVVEITTEETPTDVTEADDEAVIEVVDVEPETTEEATATPVKKRKKSYAPFVATFLLIAGIIAIICVTVVPAKINESKYSKATEYMSNKEYNLAIPVFAELGEYEDSLDKLNLAKYSYACQLEEQGKFSEAKEIYVELDKYEDSIARASSCTYNLANKALEAGKFDEAKELYKSVPDYADSKTQVLQCDYQKGVSLISSKEYAKAIEIFVSLADYADCKDRVLEAKYKYVKDHMSKDDETTVAYLKDLIEARYQDSVILRRDILGDGVVTDGVITSITYSETDDTNNLTEADRTKPIYFHIAVGAAELYGKQLTVKFTTSVGYTERKHATFSANNNTYTLMYPSTNVTNYTVEFSVVSPDGTTIASQTVTIK